MSMPTRSMIDIDAGLMITAAVCFVSPTASMAQPSGHSNARMPPGRISRTSFVGTQPYLPITLGSLSLLMLFLPKHPFKDEYPFARDPDLELEEPDESEHSESDDSDYDPAAEVFVDEPSDSESDSGLDEEVLKPPIQIQQTAQLRANFECTRDAKIPYARSGLLNSQELPHILQCWWKPPQTTKKHRHPKGALSIMQEFAFECSQEVLEQELESLADLLKYPAGEDVMEKELTGTSLPEMVIQVKKNFTQSLEGIDAIGTVIETAGAKPQKRSSQDCGHLQKLFAIYFKFKGLSAKGFDTLHAIELTMSNKWTGDAVGRISDVAMDDLKKLMDRFPWLMSDYNILLAFRIFSQRIDKKNLLRLGNGTAGIVHLLLFTSSHDTTLQYLLGTVNIPDASYEDNSHLILEYLWQLRLRGKKLQRKIGLEEVMAWIGNQLTVDRLHHLFKFRVKMTTPLTRLAHCPSWISPHLDGVCQFHSSISERPKDVDSVPHSINWGKKACRLWKRRVRELWLEVSGAKCLADLRADN
ncbi:hypothetical protein DFH07DRAFT_785880 [Mycena maculata]|uniref:DUF6589 domain-containing protein n=1 Tax=Mycena maculata TaxID=230809 RepID=A0AAD7H7D2_9AGAR|nr:hypothetical protein DFH07DRAFT_785880 [Mycena maculata]